jgi:NTE family protein
MTTAFVLSGGGSLGAVQVGMLQALSSAGIEPDLLVGISAGAVNATWVAGHGMSRDSLGELAQVWRRLRRNELFPIHLDRVLGALLGRTRAVTSSDRLGELVREHAGFDDLTDAAIETHLVATNLLTGHPVLLSTGPVDAAVRASAAVPGLYPPVLIDGQFLIDGGVAHGAGVEDAIALGATTIWVLPTGYPCALTRPPRSAVGVALQALTLLTEQRLITGVAAHSPDVTVKVLPPLCPLAITAADFSHAAELIDRARRATAGWLADGGPDLPAQERFLALHNHPEQLTRKEENLVRGRRVRARSASHDSAESAGPSFRDDPPRWDAHRLGSPPSRPVGSIVRGARPSPLRSGSARRPSTASGD